MFTITNKSQRNTAVHKSMAILIIHIELFAKVGLHYFKALDNFLKVSRG